MNIDQTQTGYCWRSSDRRIYVSPIGLTQVELARLMGVSLSAGKRLRQRNDIWNVLHTKHQVERIQKTSRCQPAGVWHKNIKITHGR